MMEGYKDTEAYFKYTSFIHLEIKTLMLLGQCYRRMDQQKRSLEVYRTCVEKLEYLIMRMERTGLGAGLPSGESKKHEHLTLEYYRFLSLLFLNISKSLEDTDQILSAQAMVKIACFNLEDLGVSPSNGFYDTIKMNQNFLSGKVASR